jgi:hypothetical protein
MIIYLPTATKAGKRYFIILAKDIFSRVQCFSMQLMSTMQGCRDIFKSFKTFFTRPLNTFKEGRLMIILNTWAKKNDRKY